MAGWGEEFVCPEYQNLSLKQRSGMRDLEKGICSFYSSFVPKNEGLTSKQKKPCCLNFSRKK